MIFKENTLSNKITDLLLKFIDSILSKYYIKIFYSLKKNLIAFKSRVIYIDGGGNWAIKWVGKNITYNLNKLGLIRAGVGLPLFAKNKIIHWGSINYYLYYNKHPFLSKKNKNIISWMHLAPDDKSDKRIKLIPILNKKIDVVHVPNVDTYQKLVNLGFSEEKVRMVHLGVDLLEFKQYSDEEKNKLRDKFNIPKDKIIIGSFQKDGVGWEDGLVPKLVKGPDLFCKVLKKINKKAKIHVFLTGPSRGYVKQKLDESQISYTHLFLDNYLDIVDCYNTLDLYLITSRSEGGPLALVEGMATGIPIISTNVGMASEIITHGINGFIAESENIDQLYQYTIKLIESSELKEKFIKNGLNIVKKFSWEELAKKYYTKIYRSLE